MIRSLFIRVLVWFGAMLLFSIAAFILTFWFLPRSSNPALSMNQRLSRMQLDDAVRAYESGGAGALQIQLAKMDEYFPGKHHLYDATGKDLVSGKDERWILSVPPPRPPRIPFMNRPPGPHVFARHTTDNRYVLAAIMNEPAWEQPNLLPYFSWIVVVLVLLSWILAFTLVKPLQQLRSTLLRFAEGDLSVRARSKRRDEIGDLARAFDVMADRTETLLTAERRLLQDISHELRSPLTRLSFATELARKSNNHQESLDRVKKETARLSHLVDELIEMTRAEGDPSVIERERMELGAFVQDIISECSIEAEAKLCQIRLRQNGTGYVRANRELLRRAVENILRNAIRYSPPGDQIEVSVALDDLDGLITVRDHGPGVPEDQLGQIFKPFFRVEDDRSRQSGGVGLGLAIAQRSVQLHHGLIDAENANPGLRVTIRVPLDQAA